jgi:peptidoglycan lytic transglycosylase
MMPARAYGLVVPPLERPLGTRFARAQRLAAFFALALFVLGTALPGDAVARSVKARVKKAKRESGVASYYGSEFAFRRTSSGEMFDPHEMTAAHRTLPFGTKIRVTNLANGRRVVLRVNDRGPYRKGRVVDVSYAAARKLGFANRGIARVRIDVLSHRDIDGPRMAHRQPAKKTAKKTKSPDREPVAVR